MHWFRATLTALGAIAIVNVTAPETLAKDAYVKGGFIFHPSEADFSNRWLGAFGLDFPLNLRETLHWGIELQGAVYNVTERGIDGTVIPANGFINFKFKADKFSFRPYAGIGMGLVTAFTLVGDSNEWTRHGGFHFQAGLQMSALMLEFQAQRAFADDQVFEYAFMAGIVF